MAIVTVPNVLRLLEMVVDIIIIAIYYSTDTCFCHGKEAGENFGQFVIIGGLVCAFVFLIICFFLDLDRKMPYLVISYNIVWIIFYLTAACLILTNYVGAELINFIGEKDTFDKMKRGGITVGVFCIINVVILIVSSSFVFVGRVRL
ncbi:UNVERIFIED_CONTAM: hypothetical protein RMT77_012486 [Armadillidium vulgare]